MAFIISELSGIKQTTDGAARKADDGARQAVFGICRERELCFPWTVNRLAALFASDASQNMSIGTV